ncbi:hypothetical protein, partial [Craterilacuibacter sp.]|uniref:hypothetical protein n=1 Tax=Craterilacuibacter sp. TaxID=2870909 RepID=UPI003F3CD086
DRLSNGDMVNYLYTIGGKVNENDIVMKQITNNAAEQALLGDFPSVVDNAIIDSREAHENQAMQLLSDPKKTADFARVVFDLLAMGR